MKKRSSEANHIISGSVIGPKRRAERCQFKATDMTSPGLLLVLYSLSVFMWFPSLQYWQCLQQKLCDIEKWDHCSFVKELRMR